MVLWEITLGTAYFLGLKRTYRLALKIQRRLITPKHPKIRQFVRRRTRAIFDVALKVHYNVQQRDIEVGRNLGNWILRWLDRMKPSAHIRGPPEKPSCNASSSMSMTKQVTNPTQLKSSVNNQTCRNQDSGRHLFTSWPKPLASISMLRVPKPLGTLSQYRHISFSGTLGFGSPNYTNRGFGGVFRNDIIQWMKQN